jgi:hypothetical protein
MQTGDAVTLCQALNFQTSLGFMDFGYETLPLLQSETMPVILLLFALPVRQYALAVLPFFLGQLLQVSE